jgi:hypothetical protein
MNDLDQKIRKHVDRNYPELAGARLFTGIFKNGCYRVIATDKCRVMHILNINLGRTQ